MVAKTVPSGPAKAAGLPLPSSDSAATIAR
jgi:hypothetical protein